MGVHWFVKSNQSRDLVVQITIATNSEADNHKNIRYCYVRFYTGSPRGSPKSGLKSNRPQKTPKNWQLVIN